MRPNILLITSDQQRWDALGVANRAIRTPNLDRLAARGIVFERAYTVNPVCTPTRCSMLTGQYPSRHGCFHVGTNLPDDYPASFARDLAEAGYFTAITGKSHFQAEYARLESVEPKPLLFDFDFHRSWSGPHFGFEHARLNVGHTSEAVACSRHYGLWLREKGVPLERYFGIHRYAHFGPWELPEEYHSSRWVADETIAAVEAAGAQARPFCVWANFPDPHNPYVAPEPWASLYAPDDMPEPAPPLSSGDKPPFYAAIHRDGSYGNDPALQERNWGDCRIQPEMDLEKTRRLRAVYQGMVSLMDWHIGRIIDHLDAAGLTGNTLVVFTSDHGDYLGDYGLWGKGLPAYESIQRVPFIVAHPACATPGARSPSLQSLVDLRATFRQAAGFEQPAPDDQGVSQLGAWLDAGTSCRDRVRIEFRPSQGPYFQTTLVAGHHKLVLYRNRDYGELYDLEQDPLQQRNLWSDAAQRPLRDELVERLAGEVVSEDEECVRERMAYA